MDYQALIAEFEAKGGKVTEVPKGRRGMKESEVRALAHGTDDERDEVLRERGDPTDREAEAQKARELAAHQDEQFKKATHMVNESVVGLDPTLTLGSLGYGRG